MRAYTACFHRQTCCHVSCSLFPVRSRLGMDVRKNMSICLWWKVGNTWHFCSTGAQNCHQFIISNGRFLSSSSCTWALECDVLQYFYFMLLNITFGWSQNIGYHLTIFKLFGQKKMFWGCWCHLQISGPILPLQWHASQVFTDLLAT